MSNRELFRKKSGVAFGMVTKGQTVPHAPGTDAVCLCNTMIAVITDSAAEDVAAYAIDKALYLGSYPLCVSSIGVGVSVDNRDSRHAVIDQTSGVRVSQFVDRVRAADDNGPSIRSPHASEFTVT